MAARQSHRYLGGADMLNSPPLFSDHFEFDESEVWSADDVVNPPETKKPATNPRPIRKPMRKSGNGDRLTAGAKSLPVNIPDWSKILRGGEYRNRRVGDCGDDEEAEEEDVNDRMPPHEYLARTRVASLSVHEGAGRTLKGRDLSRVRNAIWKQIGFED